MIKHITIRDAQGRIRAFLRNQDMSKYDNVQWSIGKDVNGDYVSYATIGNDCNMTLASGQNVIIEFFMYFGDTMSLEPEGAVQINNFTSIQ